MFIPTTMTQHFAHAATMLARRPHFTPHAMYSDTWPHKKEFWASLFPDMEGRLGLFHFQKRILRTLRKKHIDFFEAVTSLLEALYDFHWKDYENLLEALKQGTLSPTGKCYTVQEISEMKMTKHHHLSLHLQQ